MLICKISFCLPFCLLANYTDHKQLRIPNQLVLLLAGSGLLVQLCTAGLHGLASWATGLLPAFVLFPFFALHMMGAGDIKLLSAIGGVLGATLAAWHLALSLLASGVVGLLVLLHRGILGARLRVLGRYLRSCWLARTILPYTGEDEGAAQGKCAFSYGITLGLLLLMVFR